MAATITATASPFAVGNRQYCFDARSSTVAAGTLQTIRAAWWYRSLGGVVSFRHHGLELVCSSQTSGEQFDLLIVDEDGTAESATPVTTTVSTAWSFTCYISTAARGGSDSNTGLAGSPVESVAAMNAVLRAGWVPGGEMRVVWDGAFSVTSPAGGYIWNHCTTSTGTTALTGRVTWEPHADGATIAITDNTSGAARFAGASSANHGFFNSGVSVTGPYTIGVGGTLAVLYSIPTTVAGTGHNFGLRDCSLGGVQFAIDMPTTGVAVSERANGAFDWFTVERCTLTDVSSYHISGGPFRYHGLHGSTFGNHNGDSTGTSWRCNRVEFMSHSGNTFDRSGSTWKANVWRINGGANTGAQDNARFISVYDCHIVNCVEGFEIDQDNSSVDRYCSDIWFKASSYDPDPAGISTYFLGVNNGGGTVGQDLTNLRVTDCWSRAPGSRSDPFIAIDTNGSATTPRIHSVRVEGCGFYQHRGGQFFSRATVFLRCNGNAANYDDASLTVISNYAYCAEPTGGGSNPSCFTTVPAAAKVAIENHNVCAFVAPSGLTWSGADSLVAWRAATVHGDQSIEAVSSSGHNFTSITAGSIDLRPASGTGHQIGVGMPGQGYSDADRYLRDPTAPEAGPWEWSPTTLMPDPTFGGGAVVVAAATPQRLRMRLGLGRH